MIILFVFISIATINYITSKKVKAYETQQYTKAKAIQVKTQDKVNNWYMKVNEFRNVCQKQNELIVLEGTRDIKCTISNQDFEVSGKGKKSMLYFLQKWYKDMNTKTMNVYASYRYEYTVNLSNIYIEDLSNETIHIKLNTTDIKLKTVSEVPDQTVIQTDIGLLSKNFTPQETSAIMLKAHTDTFNGLITNDELYSMALENTKADLEEIADKLNVKIEINTEHSATITNMDADVIQDSNI